MEHGKAENIIALVKDAQTSYLEEVEKGKKVYGRYVKDFLNSHRYSGSWDVRVMNEHRKNMGMVEDLLETRQDLVEKFFLKEEMTEEDINILIHELNTTEVTVIRTTQIGQPHENVSTEGHVTVTNYVPATKQNSASSLQLTRKEGLIGRIVEMMNTLKLFTENVNEVQIQKLFDCVLEKPLVARNNRVVAYYFDTLCENGLISKQWQETMAAHQLVRSSTGKIMKPSDLSSALCKAKASASPPMRTEIMEELSAEQIVPAILRILERIGQMENAFRQLGDIKELHERMEQMEGHLFAAKEILTVKEAKEFLGISESQLYKLTRTLAIPHYKPSGKTIFFSRQEIIDWVKSRPARRRGMQQENINTNVSDESPCNNMDEQNLDGENISNDMP